NACDWAFALEDSNDLSLVEAALDKVLSAGLNYLEAPDSEEGLAAADVVARLQGHVGEQNSYTEPVDTWVAAHRIPVPATLAHKALAAIERILAAPSELVDLWQEGEEFEAWQQAVHHLKSRIHA
ncbi:MAG: DUF4259 domain-containing protein, partial [Nitrospira sp.]|nr:DUF4259 domain-containing protein [Nitrospira sp.]